MKTKKNCYIRISKYTQMNKNNILQNIKYTIYIYNHISEK